MARTVAERRIVAKPQEIAHHTDKIIRSAKKGSELHQAAIRWGREYCEFAGYSPSKASEIAENAKVEEKCGERVERAYEKYV